MRDACKILIAEDEPDILRLLEIKLERFGFKVFTASDGIDAVRLAHIHQPDAVLMDIMMPELDGHQAMMIIKHEVKPPPLVLMITALDQTGDMQQLLRDGADDYIVKPFTQRDVIERLNVALIKSGKTPGHPIA